MSDDTVHDEINNKVVSIFKRHRRGDHFHFDLEEGGEMVISPDGFNYVSIKYDNNSGNNGEESQLEVAAGRHYLVKMMEVHHDPEQVRLNNYYIPGERLEEFLLSLPQRPGKCLEIKQILPDYMA
jgi:hypothetical protein